MERCRKAGRTEELLRRYSHIADPYIIGTDEKSVAVGLFPGSLLC